MKKNNGFTLVEVLAVIAILGLILIIAIPKINDTVSESKAKSLIVSARTIAEQAEKIYMENYTLGKNTNIECSEVTKMTTADYDYCEITFDDNGKALVTIEGKGKFEGLAVCDATKKDGEISNSCFTDEACFAYEELEEEMLIQINYNGCFDYFRYELGDEIANNLCTGGSYEGMALKDLVTMEEDPEEIAEMLVSDGILDGYEYITPVSITGYDINCGTDVSIPRTIDNKMVRKIGNYAFTTEGETVTPLSNSKSNYKFKILENDLYTANIMPIDTVEYGIGITSIKLPKTITEIGDHAFRENEITKLDLSKLNELKIIGMRAFLSNEIASLKLNDNIYMIGISAFSNNNISGKLDLSKIFNIGDDAFSSNQITGFKLPPNITTLAEQIFSNNNISGTLDLSIYTQLETIQMSAFSDNNIESVLFPESLKNINRHAFANNSISSLILPSSVISIAGYAFTDNPLSYVKLGNTNVSMDSCAFGNVSTIANHNIPSSYTCN